MLTWVDANMTGTNFSEDVFSKFSFKNFFSSTCFGVWHSGRTIEETLPFE